MSSCLRREGDRRKERPVTREAEELRKNKEDEDEEERED